MITLLICTALILGLTIGFWFARSLYQPLIEEAKGDAAWNRFLRERQLSRTDAENAAGMVS